MQDSSQDRPEASTPKAKTIVVCDADIEDLVPPFLEHREQDVRSIHAAVQAGDFQTVQSLGHSMKGAGGGYGFDRITEIGAELEAAGIARDAASALHWNEELSRYLAEIEVRYE